MRPMVLADAVFYATSLGFSYAVAVFVYGDEYGWGDFMFITTFYWCCIGILTFLQEEGS